MTDFIPEDTPAVLVAPGSEERMQLSTVIVNANLLSCFGTATTEERMFVYVSVLYTM